MVWKKRITGKQEERKATNIELKTRLGPRRFTLIELSDTMNNFSYKLGEGGFGHVYKGVLSDSNTEVAVKKISKESKRGRKEYIAEVRIISGLRHVNLVKLIGWCHEQDELLLVRVHAKWKP